MKSLKLDLSQIDTIALAKQQAKQQGWEPKSNSLHQMAIEIRDDLGLKKCVRICSDYVGKTDTFIFTEL